MLETHRYQIIPLYSNVVPDHPPLCLLIPEFPLRIENFKDKQFYKSKRKPQQSATFSFTNQAIKHTTILGNPTALWINTKIGRLENTDNVRNRKKKKKNTTSDKLRQTGEAITTKK